MKRRKLWILVLLLLAGMVLAAVMRSSSSHRELPTGPLEENERVSAPSPVPAPVPPSSNVWYRPPVPDDPVRREVRRQSELQLMETAGEAMSGALPSMGFTEEEVSQVRQGFDDYKAGCLRIVRERIAPRKTADSTDATLPWNVYHQRLQQILGEERAGKLESAFREQQLNLVKSHRARH